MRELIVVLAFLARCWKVIDFIGNRNCALPLEALNEVQALRRDLGGFFSDPNGSLGPLMGQALEVEGAQEEVNDGPASVDGVGGSLGARGTDVTKGDAAVAEPVRLTCSQCGGTGRIKANSYIGNQEKLQCPLCSGVGSVSAPLPGVRQVTDWTPDQIRALSNP